MEENLRERYNAYEDEKLFEILTSTNNEYEVQALEIARDILIERGHNINLKALFTAQFDSYFDEDLIEIVESRRDTYQLVAIEAIEDILKQRGYEIETETEKKAQGFNFKPLIIGIILLAFNFYLSGEIYRYNITGIGSEILISYVRDVGIFHDVLIRLIVIGIIAYYSNKQKSKYLGFWVIAGIIFGAWALIVVGFSELMTDYSTLDEENNNEN